MMGLTFDERIWLAWLVKVRIIIITFLLGVGLAITNLTATAVSKWLFASVILLWYTIGVFYALLLQVWREYRVQARLQVLVDLVLGAALLYVTGGIDTSFNFLYPLIIITAAILLPRYWAYLTAAVAFILFGAILELTYFEFIPSYSITRPDLRSLQITIVVNLFAYMAIAYLASYLVAKLRKVDVQLQEKSGALEELQALHENIVRSMSGGLITTNLDGNIHLVNPAGERLLDRSQYEMMGQPVQRIFAADLARVGESRRELQYRTPSGVDKTFGMAACSLTGPEREAVGRVYTFTDLTEIRRLEREILVRDRLAAMGRLASGIAHEIRNPLAAIAGSAQMLRDSPGIGEDERALLDIVHRESERLNKIVTDFLAYSRSPKQYRFSAVDVVPLVEETLRLVENRPECANGEVKIVRRFEIPEVVADADGDRLRQVFWNVCDNAFRAMPEGGTLTVSVTPSADGFVISFADTGKGMDRGQMENLFEPFHSHFESGTGLGLAIVYQVMEAHGGSVSVHSAPGRGTQFSLHLRRAARADARPAAPTAVGGSVRG